MSNGDLNQTPLSPTEAITKTLTSKPFESKKWIAMAIGVSCVLFVWAATMACMFIKTSIANEFVSLSTIVISFIGAMVTLLITGQSAMEWNATSALSQMNSDNRTLTDSSTQPTLQKSPASATVTVTTQPTATGGIQSEAKPFSQPAT